MEKTKTISNFKKETVVDKDSGELHEVRLDTKSVEMGDFIKFQVTFDDDIEDGEILKYFGTSFSLFYKLLRYVSWATCYVSPVGRIKKDLCTHFGIKPGMLEAHLREYRRLGLMKRVDTGTYMVNPMKVYVGDTHTQRKLCIAYSNEVDLTEDKKGAKDGI